MTNGANEMHQQLRKALQDYIKSQYFGKSPVLLSAVRDKLEQEDVLYRKPYIESSPAYKSATDGIRKSKKIPEWLKEYFGALAAANLGVFPSPFCHQISALETAQEGRDLFVSTGTGSGKTECFMWPLMAKLASEARNSPKSWQLRGVRAIIMYPMNALVSDQISRLRRLIGDPGHEFVRIFRKTCGDGCRRPQFGMYTGRTPYPGDSPRSKDDKELAERYKDIFEKTPDLLQKLIQDGKLPAKENFEVFREKLRESRHVPDEEDAELVTRFEIQKFCPDILITNYSMLEYMLLRPREKKIWEDTKQWLDASAENTLLFIIDEAHMYRGSAGGEVSFLIRRLFRRLGIGRDRVQFILTTASMPSGDEDDINAVQRFANDLTASDAPHSFCYLTGEREAVGGGGQREIPFHKFAAAQPEDFEGDQSKGCAALNNFWTGIENSPAPFASFEEARRWLYAHLADYAPFCAMFAMCRGEAVSLEELAERAFPGKPLKDALHAAEIMLAIAPIAQNEHGGVLFPARMHMLFRGIKGAYACTNPKCPNAHTKGGLTLGEVYLSDGNLTCRECGSSVYELYNDRRCGSLFFRGFVLKDDLGNKKSTYLWHQPGMAEDEMKEIHLFIPPDGFKNPRPRGKNQIQPCYLDVSSGYINFSDDSWAKKPGIRKLYYSDFEAKGRPGILTFSTCPHCRHELSKRQLTSFGTKGNLPFFNLIQAQFRAQPPVPDKMGDPDRMPNEGRKVLLFSDSRQRAAKLARDMSDASDMTAARQLMILAIDLMERSSLDAPYTSMDCLYDFFAMLAAEKHVRIFHEQQQKELMNHGAAALKGYLRAESRKEPYRSRYNITNAPDTMKEHLLRLYCGGYNTFTDAGLSWIEPVEDAMNRALEDLQDEGIEVDKNEFMELFNAWILWLCDSFVALGHTIPERIREKVRPNYAGYGIDETKTFSAAIMNIMGWKKDDPAADTWAWILRDNFTSRGQFGSDKDYIDLTRVKARFDLKHRWFRCERCSELTPYLLKGKCPSCESEKIHPMTADELDALDFWRRPIEDALRGERIRVIDTEEHTAQVSHKDQRDALWSKTEQYELRFQDFLKEGETPVDILSSTTTMEAGIDIGSLVAVGLRNIPPMRENYQQRAGRAGRRGSSLSTIVTFCEDAPHDSLYFSNPAPIFRGDARRPWIDVHSEKIIRRHLSMIALQSYLNLKSLSMDSVPAIEFLDEHLQSFIEYLNSNSVKFDKNDIPASAGSETVVQSFRRSMGESLTQLKAKRDRHPELFDGGNSEYVKKSLLDALYEEGIIPTYSFPKNVVSAYIFGADAKLQYQVERGLDIAIGEYAPGRAIVVDKTTYQIGGLYCPSRDRAPARKFIEDANYKKDVWTCSRCGWFGLSDDKPEKCPFCGNSELAPMLPMLRPWGFAPRDAKSTEDAQLNEEYSAIQQPLYSTLPEADDVSAVPGSANIRMAVRANQRVIMLNKGTNDKGFTICCDCGAIMPGSDPSVLKGLKKPYPDKFSKSCKHTHTLNVNLGYDFITDMLVLEFSLDRKKIDVDIRKNSWLNRSAQSLAEALRLALCQELDIEFSELVTGYRVRQNQHGDFVDIYLHDSLSSGAGYAVSVAPIIRKILKKTRALLENCDCDTACHKCLKHYRNQHIHGMLDRKAALNLLDWGERGQKAPSLPKADQKERVNSLKHILSSAEAGITVQESGETIWAVRGRMKKEIVVYPAMWAKPISDDVIYISDSQLMYAKPHALKTIIENLS